jgi:hypothetical protein
MIKETSTFMDATIGSALDERQGRFAQKAPIITGLTEYPRQPENSPWSQGAAMGVEPPFPTDVNFVPPVGEAHERFAPSSSSSPISDDGGAPSGQIDPRVLPSPVEQSEPEGVIPDGWEGERRADGVPMGNPLGTRVRRA